jgi:hypothetical protein
MKIPAKKNFVAPPREFVNSKLAERFAGKSFAFRVESFHQNNCFATEQQNGT